MEMDISFGWNHTSLTGPYARSSPVSPQLLPRVKPPFVSDTPVVHLETKGSKKDVTFMLSRSHPDAGHRLCIDYTQGKLHLPYSALNTWCGVSSSLPDESNDKFIVGVRGNPFRINLS